ncbi:MAG: ferrous iron transport protein B [Vampirovibrionales bacterium]
MDSSPLPDITLPYPVDDSPSESVLPEGLAGVCKTYWPQGANTLPSAKVFPLNTIAMVGNPNVGKSVLFGALTGQYAQVSNIPGTTLELMQGTVTLATLPNSITLIDTPGLYGLSLLNEEERVAQAGLHQAHMVLNLVSLPTLERDLFLTQQLIDYGYPVVVAVNQLDEYELNLQPDAKKHFDRSELIAHLLQSLASQLGVPVLGIVATKRWGIETLKAALPLAQWGHATPDLRAYEPQWEKAQLAGQALMHYEQQEANPKERLSCYGARRHYLKGLLSQLTTLQQTYLDTQGIRPSVASLSSNPLLQLKHLIQEKGTLSTMLSRVLLHPVWGSVALILTLLALYQVVGVWIAGDLVDIMESWFVDGLNPWLVKVLAPLFPQGSWWHSLFLGEFGILTGTLRYVFGVMTPLVVGFYIYMALLEDTGYLPRIATLSDSFMRRLGLNGRAIIPMILGLGCVTMASVSTRMLGSQRERTIASVLMAVTIPCSAQLGVITALMATQGGVLGWVAFLTTLALVFGIMGRILQGIIPGQSSALMMDIPPLRLPQWRNVLQKVWIRSKGFLFDTAPVFMLGSALVSLATLTGLMQLLEQWMMPLVTLLLKLPPESAKVFIMGMIRRDFGVAGLYDMAKTLPPLATFVSLVVITLFVPCFASASVIWKERGAKEGLVIILLSWSIAFLVGGIIAHSASFFLPIR